MEFNLTSIIAIFAASLAGSFHCTSMCGGISLSVTQGKFNLQLAYHGLRLLGYLSIGAIAGLLGKSFFFTPKMQTLGMFLGYSLGVILFVTGTMILMNKKIQFHSKSFAWIAKKLMTIGFKLSPLLKATTVGFATVFLPCGWLYTFVLLSLATHSLVGGILTLFVFWLGTLPALMGGQLLLRKMLQKLELSGKKMTGILIMLAGIFSIQLHFYHHDASVANEDENSKSILICH